MEAPWLQIVETPVEGAPSLHFFQSKILCSKVFKLETVSTQQLDKGWENDEKRKMIFDREREIDSDDELDQKQIEEEIKAHELKLAMEAEVEKKAGKKKKREVGAR